ncbi:hypothetical protein CDAR_288901 [Caerostris darwini]|uniref:Uncharacterized protein n=1 Tax=Caerostris darwini TaxID=1538125 RepID=A0AAV4Q1J6_9ARAC|nr:hypothetical protein CDAR_288901 [Caerostris darwini]
MENQLRLHHLSIIVFGRNSHKRSEDAGQALVLFFDFEKTIECNVTKNAKVREKDSSAMGFTQLNCLSLIRSNMIFIYTFRGCDGTTASFGQGKIRLCNIVHKSPETKHHVYIYTMPMSQ